MNKKEYKHLWKQCKRDRKNIIKEAKSTRPWDYVYILSLLKIKLVEMRNYFNSGLAIGVPASSIAKQINTAIYLIDVIMSDGSESDSVQLFSMNYDKFFKLHTEIVGSVNPRDTENVLKSIHKFNNLPPETYDYKCLVNVNIRNVDRFLSSATSVILKDEYVKQPHQLYQAKANNLLFKYLDHYIWGWRD